MARGRMLNQKISDNPTVNSLDYPAQVLHAYMIAHLDRDGLMVGEAALVKAKVLPWKDDLTVDQVDAYLSEMHDKGLIMRYQHGGRQYIFFPRFRDEQPNMRYSKEGASEYPAPPGYVRTDEGLVMQEIKLEPTPESVQTPDKPDREDGQDKDEVTPYSVRTKSGPSPDLGRSNAVPFPPEEKRREEKRKIPSPDFFDLAMDTARRKPPNIARLMTNHFHELTAGGPMSDVDPLADTWTREHQKILNRADQAHKHLKAEVILDCIDQVWEEFPHYTWPQADGGYGRQLNLKLRQAMNGRQRAGPGRKSAAENRRLAALAQQTLEALNAGQTIAASD